MGYWGIHPLSGDMPLDALYILDIFLFTKEEIRNNEKFNDIEYAKRLKDELKIVSEIEYYSGFNFVLPFKIAQLKLKIKDNELSKKIKNMIGDGGAKYRGYSIKESNKFNGYNNFESPNDYAGQLEDNWDSLMEGTINFDVLKKSKGLIETINEHIGPDLINIK